MPSTNLGNPEKHRTRRAKCFNPWQSAGHPRASLEPVTACVPSCCCCCLPPLPAHRAFRCFMRFLACTECLQVLCAVTRLLHCQSPHHRHVSQCHQGGRRDQQLCACAHLCHKGGGYTGPAGVPARWWLYVRYEGMEGLVGGGCVFVMEAWEGLWVVAV